MLLDMLHYALLFHSHHNSAAIIASALRAGVLCVAFKKHFSLFNILHFKQFHSVLCFLTLIDFICPLSLSLPLSLPPSLSHPRARRFGISVAQAAVAQRAHIIPAWFIFPWLARGTETPAAELAP